MLAGNLNAEDKANVGKAHKDNVKKFMYTKYSDETVEDAANKIQSLIRGKNGGASTKQSVPIDVGPARPANRMSKAYAEAKVAPPAKDESSYGGLSLKS